MGAFEHVISLLSFVYALAIAHLLTTVARIIGAQERVKLSWFHAYWMLNALFVLVIDWVSYWDMHNIPNWTIASLAIVLLQAFADYMQAALVCPEIPEHGTVDLVEFHRTRARRYIGAFAVVTIVAFLDNFYFGSSYNIGEVLSQNLRGADIDRCVRHRDHRAQALGRYRGTHPSGLHVGVLSRPAVRRAEIAKPASRTCRWAFPSSRSRRDQRPSRPSTRRARYRASRYCAHRTSVRAA